MALGLDSPPAALHPPSPAVPTAAPPALFCLPSGSRGCGPRATRWGLGTGAPSSQRRTALHPVGCRVFPAADGAVRAQLLNTARGGRAGERARPPAEDARARQCPSGPASRVTQRDGIFRLLCSECDQQPNSGPWKLYIQAWPTETSPPSLSPQQAERRQF